MPPAEPEAAATCAKETKRLKTFKRGMKAAKKRFFRTHRAKKARKRFLKQQKAKLTRLTRALKRCRANQSPGGWRPARRGRPAGGRRPRAS